MIAFVTKTFSFFFYYTAFKIQNLMNRHNPSSMYVVSDLDFDKTPSSNTNTCLVAALAAVVLYMTIIQPQQMQTQMMESLQNTSSTAAGMLSSVMDTVSARIADVTNTVALTDGTLTASKVLSNVSNNTIRLIDADNAAKNNDAYKHLTEQDKEKNGMRMKNWLKHHDNAVVMVFARWCEHCHNSMKPLSEAVSKSGHSCLMVNADAVPTHLIDGGSTSISLIEYFPTFLVKKNGVMETARSADDATQKLENALQTATAAGVVSLNAIEEEDSGSTPFDNLF